jgi:hypothetical protein
MQQLKGTSTQHEVLHLCSRALPHLHHIEAIASIVRLAQLHHSHTPADHLPPDALPTFHSLLLTFQQHSSRYQLRHISNLIWALGKLQRTSPLLTPPATLTTADSLAQHCLQLALSPSHQGTTLLASANSQDISNILWGLARLQPSWLTQQHLQHLTAASAACLPSSKPQELSNSIWALAKLGHHSSTYLEAFTATTAPQADALRTEHVSIIAWACAKLRHKDACLLEALSATATARIRSFPPQSIATMAWACATLQHRDPALLQALCNAARWKHRKLTPQALSNLVWALGKLGQQDTQLSDLLTQQAALRLPEMAPLGLATMATAWASAGRSSPVLLAAVARRTLQLLPQFHPATLARLLAALAQAGQADSGFWGAALAHVERHVGSYTAADCCSVLWALACSGCHTRAPTQALLVNMLQHVEQLDAKQLVKSLWSCATLQHVDATHLAAAAAALRPQLQSLGNMQLCVLAWALHQLAGRASMLGSSRQAQQAAVVAGEAMALLAGSTQQITLQWLAPLLQVAAQAAAAQEQHQQQQQQQQPAAATAIEAEAADPIASATKRRKHLPKPDWPGSSSGAAALLRAMQPVLQAHLPELESAALPAICSAAAAAPAGSIPTASWQLLCEELYERLPAMGTADLAACVRTLRAAGKLAPALEDRAARCVRVRAAQVARGKPCSSQELLLLCELAAVDFGTGLADLAVAHVAAKALAKQQVARRDVPQLLQWLRQLRLERRQLQVLEDLGSRVMGRGAGSMSSSGGSTGDGNVDDGVQDSSIEALRHVGSGVVRSQQADGSSRSSSRAAADVGVDSEQGMIQEAGTQLQQQEEGLWDEHAAGMHIGGHAAGSSASFHVSTQDGLTVHMGGRGAVDPLQHMMLD